jgi:hypothetical protein
VDSTILLAGTALATSKFGNGPSSGVTVTLNFIHDKVASSKGDRRARCAGTFMMDGTMFFSQQTKDLLGFARRRKAWTSAACSGFGAGVGERLRLKGKQKGQLTAQANCG